jgi:hypothetical protein
MSIHTITLADGSDSPSPNRLAVGLQFFIENESGATGEAVTTAVSFVAGSLPSAYAVFVEVGQAGVIASVAGKTTSGFDVVLTPQSNAAVSAGTINVLVIG